MVDCKCMEAQQDTATRIIEVAQELIQVNGYNAFSYADIAKQVGIRKASIHYYFPNKSDLGKAVVTHYRNIFRGLALQLSQQVTDPRQKLEMFIKGFGRSFLTENRICLCCMLAAELSSLPQEIRSEVQGFFVEVEGWLTEVLRAGVAARVVRAAEPLETEAHLIMAALEGGVVVARAFNDLPRYETLAQRLFEHLVNFD